jgi:hypothetical protein
METDVKKVEKPRGSRTISLCDAPLNYYLCSPFLLVIDHRKHGRVSINTPTLFRQFNFWLLILIFKKGRKVGMTCGRVRAMKFGKCASSQREQKYSSYYHGHQKISEDLVEK